MAVATQKLKADTDVRSIMDRKPDAGRGAPGQATQDAEAQTKLPVHAEAGSAGDGPVQPARVRRRSVARHLHGIAHD